jgi:hypothetical protein
MALGEWLAEVEGGVLKGEDLPCRNLIVRKPWRRNRARRYSLRYHLLLLLCPFVLRVVTIGFERTLVGSPYLCEKSRAWVGSSSAPSAGWPWLIETFRGLRMTFADIERVEVVVLLELQWKGRLTSRHEYGMMSLEDFRSELFAGASEETSFFNLPCHPIGFHLMPLYILATLIEQ